MEAVGHGAKTLLKLLLVIILGVTVFVFLGWAGVALALDLIYPEGV